jgi:hypothetical protein
MVQPGTCEQHNAGMNGVLEAKELLKHSEVLHL